MNIKQNSRAQGTVEYLVIIGVVVVISLVVVGVYDGSTNKLYINGVLRDAVAVSGTLLSNTNPLEIGRAAHYTSRLLNGVVEEVAIWNRALDTNEVKELFNKSASKIGLKYRGCADSTCSTNPLWSVITYPDSNNRVSLDALDGNRFMQYALHPTLYQFPDGNYFYNAFAQVKDSNLVYSN